MVRPQRYVNGARKVGEWPYFADESMERKTPISGERPYHARCRGEEPDDRTPGKGDYDRNHYRCPGFGFDSIIEYLNEWEAGR